MRLRGSYRGIVIDEVVAVHVGHTEYVRKLRQVMAYRREIGRRLRIYQCDARLGVVEAVRQRLRSKQERHRHGDRAHLVNREVGHERFAALRQHQRHLVSAHDAETREHVRQAIGFPLQIPKRMRGRGSGFVFPVQCEAGAVTGPTATAGLRNVEVARHHPAVGGMQVRVRITGH